MPRTRDIQRIWGSIQTKRDANGSLELEFYYGRRLMLVVALQTAARSALCQFYDANLIRAVRAPRAPIGRQAGQRMTGHAPARPLTNHEPHRSAGAPPAAPPAPGSTSQKRDALSGNNCNKVREWPA